MQKYILDTNIYMNAYDRFYLPAHFPSFWDEISNHLNDCVVIPKVVMDENVKDDWFSLWIKENYQHKLIGTAPYGNEFAEVLSHIQEQEHYTDQVLIDWSREKIADTWLLAMAKKENYTIVTAETPNPNLHKNASPSKSAKIPDVAKELGIECINQNEFFARIDLKI